MDSTEIEVRRKRITTAAKWLIGGAAAFVISPIIFMVVKGIIGLAIAGAVGITVVTLAPVFAMKISNWRIKLITAEAEANPIETMKVLRVEKVEELQRSEQAITEFETEIRNYRDELQGFVKQYPEEAESYQELADKMTEALKAMRGEQKAARDKLADFEARIVKAEAIYKMALAAQRVTALSKSAEAKVFLEIKEKVAFDTVRSELNRSFSLLNSALSQRETMKTLPSKQATEQRVQNIQVNKN